MSARPFAALLWKESFEITRHAVPMLGVFIALVWLQISSAAEIGDYNNPARHYGLFGIVAMLAATSIGFWQTWREGSGDKWSFAIHRPASGAQIFGAKLLVGVTTLFLIAFVPYLATMWWLAVPGHRPVPFDRAFLYPGTADFFNALTFYAAGLYAGSRRTGHRGRTIAIACAVVAWLLAWAVTGIAAAIAISVAFMAVIAAAAWADFMSGSDFDAQPRWGRAANVAIGIPAVMASLFIIAAATGLLSTRPDPQDVSIVPNRASVTPDGRLVASRNGNDADVIIASALNTAYVPPAQPMYGDSYREPDTRVTRLFSGYDKRPLWYYERRQGLITVMDTVTMKPRGWIGPDGYSAAPTKPARRFTGKLLRDPGSPITGLLVLSTSVYALDNIAQPRHVFTAAPGETVLDAVHGELRRGAMPRDDAKWGWFRVVTTDKATYVIGREGDVQLRIPHPAQEIGRRVAVVRAPYAEGGATFVRYGLMDASRGDTVEYIREYRLGSAEPVAEYRARMFRDGRTAEIAKVSPSAVAQAASASAETPLPIYGAPRRGPNYDRATVTRAIAIWLVVGLALAGFTWRLCRRHGLPRDRATTWTALTVPFGPIALALMWIFMGDSMKESAAAAAAGA